MMTWLIALVGNRAAKPVAFGIVAAIVLAVMFALAHCSHDTTSQRQAEQTTASGDAIANAASAAIGTITNRTATDADVDRSTATALEGINNATDPDTMRGAVVDGVCRQASHRNDPACALR